MVSPLLVEFSFSWPVLSYCMSVLNIVFHILFFFFFKKKPSISLFLLLLLSVSTVTRTIHRLHLFEFLTCSVFPRAWSVLRRGRQCCRLSRTEASLKKSRTIPWLCPSAGTATFGLRYICGTQFVTCLEDFRDISDRLPPLIAVM